MAKQIFILLMTTIQKTKYLLLYRMFCSQKNRASCCCEARSYVGCCWSHDKQGLCLFLSRDLLGKLEIGGPCKRRQKRPKFCDMPILRPQVLKYTFRYLTGHQQSPKDQRIAESYEMRKWRFECVKHTFHSYKGPSLATWVFYLVSFGISLTILVFYTFYISICTWKSGMNMALDKFVVRYECPSMWLSIPRLLPWPPMSGSALMGSWVWDVLMWGKSSYQG